MRGQDRALTMCAGEPKLWLRAYHLRLSSRCTVRIHFPPRLGTELSRVTQSRCHDGAPCLATRPNGASFALTGVEQAARIAAFHLIYHHSLWRGRCWLPERDATHGHCGRRSYVYGAPPSQGFLIRGVRRLRDDARPPSHDV